MALMTKTPETRTRRRGGLLPTGLDTHEPVATVTQLHRSYGHTQVLRGLDLEIRRGEFVALLGRSGSGKSTLLRSLAGLDPTSATELKVEGSVSVAFQEPRLLPWRSVERNVGLALANGPRRRIQLTAAREALEEVGLEEKRQVWPLSLSGGQAQRASLARALVRRPDLLLLDEPFSALDALTRIEMHRLVLRLWQRHRPGVLLVTHDVDEALALADRVLVLSEGRVTDQWDLATPRSRRREAPEIAAVRAEILSALGVPTNQHTHETKETGAA